MNNNEQKLIYVERTEFSEQQNASAFSLLLFGSEMNSKFRLVHKDARFERETFHQENYVKPMLITQILFYFLIRCCSKTLSFLSSRTKRLNPIILDPTYRIISLQVL